MRTSTARNGVIEAFDFQAGRTIGGKYEIVSFLGGGWEGEVYKVAEKNTGIERAAKFFYPHRNIKNRASTFYARKLHKLYHCPIIIQYHAEESILVRKTPVTVMISELVEGEILKEFLKRQPGGRLQPFQATHLLYSLVSGLESIHRVGEYHGDLHLENIIVSRYGLQFELRLLDLFHWKAPKRENIRDDICDAVRVYYDALGGARYYSRQPAEVRAICCGLKRSLILKKFPRAAVLRGYLEDLNWN